MLRGGSAKNFAPGRPMRYTEAYNGIAEKAGGCQPPWLSLKNICMYGNHILSAPASAISKKERFFAFFSNPLKR
jgi:hypothetical protein